MPNWHDLITVDPAVCHGQATIRGTRILVSVVLANLAAGASREALLRNYPTLTPEAINAALSYGAALAEEQVIRLPA
jgi:uncharacterized protein (DUF433 family)